MTSACNRDGCNRKRRHPNRFRFCSVLCQELNGMLDLVETTCRESGHPDAGELWTSAVEAADAITEVMRLRGRVWREGQPDKLLSP
jgi:hypothetical protein